MDYKTQAEAVTAELVADAYKMYAKIANPRGEVSTKINGIEFRVVVSKGRATCYVAGAVRSRAAFTKQLESDLSDESIRIFGSAR